jgi:hypothetical protein
VTRDLRIPFTNILTACPAINPIVLHDHVEFMRLIQTQETSKIIPQVSVRRLTYSRR